MTMSIKSVLLFAGAALGRTIQYRASHKPGCGAPDPSDDMLELSRQFGVDEEYDARVNGMARSTDTAINVDVWFHSVATSNRTILPERTLQKQFDVLADVYSEYGINMTYAGSTRTVNSEWAVSRDQLAMKSKLRKGSYSDLNIYMLDKVEDNSLGTCTFPADAEQGSQEFIEDGCLVLATTVPGGKEEDYNLGLTAVHEAGHWFGLFHTFQGGCDEGDRVADTPPQRDSTVGCPVHRNSCPGRKGEDPIHNYMDYSDDVCLEEFTPGQIARIRSFWKKFRA